MIALIWEPHSRTGGGVLVRVEPGFGGATQVKTLDPRHAEQLGQIRGGRSKKHRRRIDARIRTITLIGVRWGVETDAEAYPGNRTSAIVYATSDEHTAYYDDMRRQFRDALRSTSKRMHP